MYSYDDEPICACSTPAGISGIAVIRISGNGCGKLADKCSVILRSSGDYSKLSELPGYTCAFGYVKDPSNGIKVDEVIFTHFEAPHSYTGEEMVEISSHGSGAVKQEILKCLGMSGIRMAYPGEFSRRAFINGKMSLASAEAVMDVINSETERQLEAAGSLMSGKLAEEIDYIERNLYDQAAMLETFTEFDTEDPDEEEAKLETVKDNLSDCHDRLTTLCKGYGKGRILSERLRVALLGLPNSGKSTLLNTLTGFDRAIVTEVAGTTRDTIEVQLPVSGNALLVDNYAGDWDVKLVGNNKLVLKCLKPTDHAIINAFLVKKPKELKDGFWFESMKAQLNIAAEMAKKSGKEVTAQTEGDFALSYEIMDFLKKNPNVTMNYKLSYKEVVYDLVISGKKVNPDISIPWYGPEYLIGNFYKK